MNDNSLDVSDLDPEQLQTAFREELTAATARSALALQEMRTGPHYKDRPPQLNESDVTAVIDREAPAALARAAERVRQAPENQRQADLHSRYQSELATLPRGDVNQLQALRERYRSLGWQHPAEQPQAAKQFVPRLSDSDHTALLAKYRTEMMTHRGSAARQQFVRENYRKLGLTPDETGL